MYVLWNSIDLQSITILLVWVNSHPFYLINEQLIDKSTCNMQVQLANLSTVSTLIHIKWHAQCKIGFMSLHKITSTPSRGTLCLAISWQLTSSASACLRQCQEMVRWRRIELYFVSSRERQWHHWWARPRIHAARRNLYASIPVFLFERVRNHTSISEFLYVQHQFFSGSTLL